MAKPNILWICSDQQRWDTLGCYGNKFVRTPTLDRLAANGTQFEHCFSQSPVCTPSRASFLTGRYPRTTRARQNGQGIPEDEVLVTKMLADAGYACGLSGKLHLSPCNPKWCKEMERRIDDGYGAFHWSHHSGGGWDTNEYHLWLKEKGHAFMQDSHPECKYINLGPPEELHQTTWCAEKAIDFMQEKQGTPWLFSVNMFDPHHPFDAPEERLEHYMDMLKDIPLPNYEEGELENKPRYQKIDHTGPYGGGGAHYDVKTEKDHRMIRASYWAMCDIIDSQVGRMLDALDQTGQIDNTIVIFTSDHGEMLGDHGIYLKGPYFYEPAVRVPLIISWPGHVLAQKSTALVELTDIGQTLLDALGMAHHEGMQGRSLWPLLTGKADGKTHRDDVYCEYYNALSGHKDPPAHLTMVRTDRYKIVVDHNASSGELYDLEKDPDETHNRWDDKSLSDVKMDMLLRVANRMAWTVDPLPPRRAPW